LFQEIGLRKLNVKVDMKGGEIEEMVRDADEEEGDEISGDVDELNDIDNWDDEWEYSLGSRLCSLRGRTLKLCIAKHFFCHLICDFESFRSKY
jgi:hypothetical protein